MADDNATPGRPKHKKTTRTPRRKEVLRAEKFYAYEWDKLRVNLLRGFLLAVCDQDGYKYEPEDVVKLNVAEALTEVEGFASEVDVTWGIDEVDQIIFIAYLVNHGCTSRVDCNSSSAFLFIEIQYSRFPGKIF